MSSNRSRRNKRHVPRPRIELVLAIAERLSKLDTNFAVPNPEHIDHMSYQLHAGLDRLKFGSATEDDLLNMQDAVNIALELITGENFAAALIPTRAAENALIMIDERKTATGRWVARAPELAAIDAFLPLHDAILASCPHIEIERATAAVRRDLVAA